MKQRLPIATKAAKGRSVPLSAEMLVNMYAEQAPDGARNGVCAIGCPGTLEFADISTSLVRGLYWVPSNATLWAVVGLTLYKISSSGGVTTIGTIGGFGRVSMADNGVQLVIVTRAISYVVTLASDTLTPITDSDFPNADTVAFLGGYFAFNNNQSGSDAQFFWSSLYGGSSYDALDFATAENVPDDLVAVWRDHDRVLLFGDFSIESWFLSGDSDVFAQYKGSTINRGLGARWSVANVDNGVMFIDESGIVRKIGGQSGYDAVRVSTHAIEYEINKGAWRHDDAASYDGAVGSSYIEEGHEFYVLTVPNTGTFVFDAATGLWHKRKSKGLETSRNSFHVRAFNKVICADTETGKVYEQSLDFVDEDGARLIGECQFPQISNGGGRFRVNEIELHIDNAEFPHVLRRLREIEGSSSWTQRANPFGSSSVIQIRHSFGQQWVACGEGGKAAVSYDGTTTWSSINPGFGGTTVSFVEYSDISKTWVFVGLLGKITKTSDLSTFTSIASADTKTIQGLATDGIRWINCGDNGRLEYTTDLVTWDAATSPLGSTNLAAVAYGNGIWIVCGNGNTSIGRSTDGVSWSAVATGATAGYNLELPAYGNGIWVLVAYGSSVGQGEILVSYDNAVTWASLGNPLSNQLYRCAYEDGFFVACGPGGKIGYSSDGINWTAVTDSSFGASDVQGNDFGGGVFAACGEDGKIASIQLSLSTYVSGESSGLVGTPFISLDVLSEGARESDATQQWRSIGLAGEHENRVIFRRLGQHRTFTPRFTISAPVKRVVIDATARIIFDG